MSFSIFAGGSRRGLEVDKVLLVLLLVLLPSQTKADSGALSFPPASANLVLQQQPSIVGQNDDDDDNGQKNIDLHADGRFLGRGKLSCHSCEHPHCDEEDGGVGVGICHNAVRCFTAHTRDVDGTEYKSKGCTRDLPTTAFYCSVTQYDGRHTHKINQESAQYAMSCCKENLCNNETVWPKLPDVPVLDQNNNVLLSGLPSSQDAAAAADSANNLNVILAITCPVLILALAVPLVILLLRSLHKKRMDEINHKMNVLMEHGDRGEFVGLRAHAVGDSTLREFHDDITSGSGSGMPHLVQRTLSKQIRLDAERRIGQGRYGQVWLGEFNGDAVAIKVFNSYDEDSWKRETDIYSTTLLRHDNILGYYGSDLASYNSATHMWLVTHYHPNGSLYDHLNKPIAIGTKAAHKLIISALNGIVHLHTEIHGTKGKPGIAHRDIKSKNILVRSDLSCVIADFGLAVTHKHATDELVIPENKARVGTRRYMSPEILDFSINEKTTFEAFRMADMYSFALVMWEVLRRTDLSSAEEAEPYALPYFQDVGPDPSFEEMRKVVCVDQRRPEVYGKWGTDPITQGVACYMKECWHENPSVRLSALRLRKSIAQLNPEPSNGCSSNLEGEINSISFS